jgi:hypothetical protein
MVLPAINCVYCAVVLQEWEAEQKRRQEALSKGWGPEGEEEEGGEGEGEPDDDLPFACYICR